MKLLVIRLSLIFCVGPTVHAQSEENPTTAQLIARYKENPQIDWPFVDLEPKHQPEAILSALATHGETALQSLRELRDAGKPHPKSDDAWSLSNDLALLTTIRRIERKNSPLRIEVNAGKPIKSAVRETPRIPVRIVNQDPSREAVWFTFGGDYRSGRLSRWRIHVWDANGQRLPVIGPSYGMGGGVYSQGELEFGESDDQILDLGSFVRIRRPGLYTAKVFYHDSVTIADIENETDLNDLILVASEKFELEVAPGPKIRISLSNDEYEESKALISQLRPANTIKMIGSEYGPNYHSFISPNSAHGKLLLMDHAAVPALILRLKHPDAEYRERAWILAILNSILHERYLSPTDFDGAIDDYRCQFPGGHCSSSGPPSEEAQEQLVQEWVAFARAYIIVEKRE